MSRWATQVEIAGVDLTGRRAEVFNDEGFLSPYGGSVDWSNSFAPSIQVFDRGKLGIAFGIQFATMEITKLTDILTAIYAAEAVFDPFRVTIDEGLYTGVNIIDVYANADHSQEWFKKGKHSEGYLESVTLFFISVGEYI